ncbi:MAG: Thiosulfate sulfurtransferase, rhodanese [Candidatus Saccharicenans subterraneus]|uniref:Sulfurtransferase n=1 Tax=Candidatus Saccharicenans subterraneus TaxID=2508984 RepID=A0A3E2BMT3_9BACT|nr:MAG: Thiosulfate sulfurtransferase, rhodanese [Candidatus Saccharicenans subterraneum]
MKRAIENMFRAAALLTLNLILLSGLQAQTPERRLVSGEWLEASLNLPNLRIIDMRADIRDYWAGHIPGAVYLDETALRWPQNGVPGRLIPPEILTRLLEEIGVNQKTTVIIYTEINNYRATYLAWALDYLRHTGWAILDGGFNRWKNENRPVSRDYPVLNRTNYGSKINPDESVRAVLDQVKNRDPRTTVLLDVRSAELYSGERGNWKRNGHIPGAINIFWGSFLREDGSWKDLKVVAGNLRDMGITPDKTIIVSCGQGLMASHTYLTLKYLLNYPKVRLYDGSFNEWSNRDDLPVETGQR